MNRFQRLFINYGLGFVGTFLMLFLNIILLYSKLGIVGIGIGIVTAFNIAICSYINGWFRGRFEGQEEISETLRSENASSISRQNRPKARR